MLAVQIFARVESRGQSLAEALAECVRGKMPAERGQERKDAAQTGGERDRMQIIGPAPAAIGRINDIFRFVFYVKSAKYDTLVKVKDVLEEKIQGEQLRTEVVQFDFDPVNTL